ncbi:SH3 domain-containing protein [Paracoccus xiamenensis]|uniref:SH3 domain-containing protein n=1 Tax=Paracoccus xiamenensis TaxID=2714901 RepID=UPI0038B310EC
MLAPAHALSNDETGPQPRPERAPEVVAAPAEAEASATVTPAPVRPAARPAQLAAVQPAPAAAEVVRGPVTRLPVPRYVSLKGNEGNVRRGPSLSHRIDWVFRHAGMPLRVVGEFGHWRRVEDRDGAGGWVHYRLLSGVRTAIVQQEMVELRARPDLNAGVIAMAEGGAIVRLGECGTGWCQISGAGAKGWVEKAAIWGVDADEIRD